MCHGTCAILQGACAVSSIPSSITQTWQASAYDAATLSVKALIASSNVASANSIADGSQTTYWTSSSSCYATNYLNYPDINIITNYCATAVGACSYSTYSGVSNTAASTGSATDLNTNNAVGVSLTSGTSTAWFQIDLKSPKPYQQFL
jgi:hypothetical protein